MTWSLLMTGQYSLPTAVKGTSQLATSFCIPALVASVTIFAFGTKNSII